MLGRMPEDKLRNLLVNQSAHALEASHLSDMVSVLRQWEQIEITNAKFGGQSSLLVPVLKSQTQ